MMSVPASCIKIITQQKALKLLLPAQFGVGVPAGAEMMVLQARALAKLFPNDAFCGLDMVNAFGEISRAEVLEEILAELPELAPFMVQLRGDQGTTVYVATGASVWEPIVLRDGLFQGHTLSSLLFCLGLRRALRRFTAAYQAVEPGDDIVMLAYIDDVLAKLNPDKAGVWFPLLQEALASVNLRLHLAKTKVLIPSAPPGAMHPSISANGLQQVHQHLELLGNVLDG